MLNSFWFIKNSVSIPCFRKSVFLTLWPWRCDIDLHFVGGSKGCGHVYTYQNCSLAIAKYGNECSTKQKSHKTPRIYFYIIWPSDFDIWPITSSFTSAVSIMGYMFGISLVKESLRLRAYLKQKLDNKMLRLKRSLWPWSLTYDLEIFVLDNIKKL